MFIRLLLKVKTMLIVHSPADIATQHLKQIVKIAEATSIEAITQQVFRFPGASELAKNQIADFCAHAQLDFAFVPFKRLKDFGLVAMDMDSTLITIECIDEIADMHGLKAQVAEITERAMQGELDFKASLTQRVALLAGLPESALEQVYTERLQLQPGAEKMLAAVHQAGLKTLLISGGFTFFTDKLKARLGLTYTLANQLEIIDGKLTGRVLGDIIDAQAKADHLIRLRNELGLRAKQTLAFGDGANDKLMFAAAGFSIAMRGKPALKAVANACFDYVGLDGLLNLFPLDLPAR